MYKRVIRDSIGKSLSWLASTIGIALCLGIIVYVFIKGGSRLSLSFLVREPATSAATAADSGIGTPIVGTFVLTIIGMLFAFPWALSTAIYLSEYSQRNPLAKFFRLGIDVLAGMPTVVIAMFGLAIFTHPFFGFLSSLVVSGGGDVRMAFGRSFLVCSITMAVMVLPFVIKTCEEAIKAVPESYREGSLAMGASKWHTITKIVLPSARNGLITGAVLGIGRIIGDTAIVILTLGGTLRMTGIQPWWTHWISTLTNTGSTLTSYIYFAAPSGEGNMPREAFAATIVLIIVIIILNLVTDVVGNLNKSVREE